MNVWLTARGAGLSALILLTISTSLGALVSMRGKASLRYVAQYVHRVCAGFGIGVLALHVATIIADSYAHVGVSGALVPFTSGYRATAIGLGTIALYVFLAVAVLGFARGRMAASERGARRWRGVHALSYAAWGIAVVHGFTAGTDSSIGWVRLVYAGCVAAVAGALASRLTHLRLVRVQGALK
jgi:DMSO/TMAO reductase YedYZ heme-binding membrane subunit